MEEGRSALMQLHGNTQSSTYSHRSATSEIDKMNKELKEMQEMLIKNSVRCHILEIDLATQLSPDLQDALRMTKENCSKCTETVDRILNNSNDGTKPNDNQTECIEQ